MLVLELHWRSAHQINIISVRGRWIQQRSRIKVWLQCIMYALGGEGYQMSDELGPLF